MITLDEYLKFIPTVARWPPEKADEYLHLGLISELGEFAGKMKKFIRDAKSDPVAGAVYLDGAVAELGDMLFYLVASALPWREHQIQAGLEVDVTNGLPDFAERSVGGISDGYDQCVSSGICLIYECDVPRPVGSWIIATANRVRALQGTLPMCLGDLAEANMRKLQGRLEAGTIHGDGDNR